MRREEFIAKVKELVKRPERIRNIGIVAHIDHGKTTLSDNLLFHAGMLSEEMAGKQLALDFREDERLRGITIDAANVSMVHKFEEEDYLINLIDTPGHVDFSGEVARAMKAVDGVIVVICGVEGVMPQTKSVISQALREGVKPVVFINKIDRLINELKLSERELQERLLKIITDVNDLIAKYQPEGVDWRVRVEEGSVAFGSAYHNWAISFPYMKKTGVTFKRIVECCKAGKHRELAKLAPCWEVVLDMVVRHLPNPLRAQRFRIPIVWKGETESEIGKAMLACDPKDKLVLMITNIDVFDPREGEVATARIFAGTVREGDEVYLVRAKRWERVQQVSVYLGATRANIGEMCAGNIVGLTGLKAASAGETASTDETVQPFERITYLSEPVVTVAVEARNMKDLSKLITVLRRYAKEDPTLQVKIDEETGEHLLSGMGELHLEVVTNRIKREGLDIETSEPLVVYRETVQAVSQVLEGKSPNKHNKFYLQVEPLEEGVYEAIASGKVEGGRRKEGSKDIRALLVELGMPPEEARNVVDVHRGNVLVNMTKGVQHLDEAMELILDAFEDAMNAGPIANEPVTKVKVKLMDAILHEDAVHRGPAQIYPAIKRPIYAGMLTARPCLLEPIMRLWIDVPQEYLGSVTREVQRRRAMIKEVSQRGELINLECKMPVAESFGFAGAIRSASEGYAFWSTENAGFEKLPEELHREVIVSIRKRKGLKLEVPRPEEFTS